MTFLFGLYLVKINIHAHNNQQQKKRKSTTITNAGHRQIEVLQMTVIQDFLGTRSMTKKNERKKNICICAYTFN